MDDALECSPLEVTGGRLSRANVDGGDSRLILAKALFEKQPPSNLRKSNFFHFVLSFRNGSGQLAEIRSARFVDFVEDVDNEQVRKNGIEYCLNVRNENGLVNSYPLFVRLVDSVAKKPVLYEGQDKNPEMCRVLLTHEVTCSRCSEKKSCGNRNETPSDPVIVDKYHVKFFLKCNQNCLKNAGNPKDLRRFQIAVATSADFSTTAKVLAYSADMFVHNNSKHGRKPPIKSSPIEEAVQFREATVLAMPLVTAIIPDEGWTYGGTNVVLIGENFVHGMQAAFGSQLVFTKVTTKNSMHIITPPWPVPGPVSVTLHIRGKLLGRTPITFNYRHPEEPNLEAGFQRLRMLLSRVTGVPELLSRENLLKKCGDFIESVCGVPSHGSFGHAAAVQAVAASAFHFGGTSNESNAPPLHSPARPVFGANPLLNLGSGSPGTSSLPGSTTNISLHAAQVLPSVICQGLPPVSVACVSGEHQEYYGHSAIKIEQESARALLFSPDVEKQFSNAPFSLTQYNSPSNFPAAVGGSGIAFRQS
eukprot:m.193333 g.193333  ORF g.193333 m.193333 type:complete len:532 (+) comp39477_c0_seq19:104-1699(+)